MDGNLNLNRKTQPSLSSLCLELEQKSEGAKRKEFFKPSEKAHKPYWNKGAEELRIFSFTISHKKQFATCWF